METRRTGISRELIIHPGETIADVLEDRGITQAELAARTGVSAAYVSKVITGSKGISSKFAMALEYALGVPKSFWLNLQANYEAEVLELNAEATITEGEHEAFYALKEIVKYLRNKKSIPVGETEDQTILSLRKALQISNLSTLSHVSNVGAFRMDQNTSVNPFVLGAWIQLCQIQGERDSIDTEFDKNSISSLVAELKTVMNKEIGNLQLEIATVMRKYGINFSVVHNFRGAPVHGFISQNKDGAYQMVLTIRRSFADIFWFSLFHELGHIVNGDVSRTTKYIDAVENRESDKEKAADLFASNALLDRDAYNEFIMAGNFSIEAITNFSRSQSVPPYVVIGRLQKEKHIPYNWYSSYKLRYKWIE